MRLFNTVPLTNAFTIVFNNTTFKDNRGNNQDMGGAFYLSGSGVYLINIVDSTFINNSMTQYSGAYPDGGVFAIQGNTANSLLNITNITNSTFNRNSAQMGGAISVTSANVTIINSSFNNNSATNEGGAIYARGGTSNYIIIGTNFTNNSAPIGSAISIAGGNINITNTTFKNHNRATQTVWNNGNLTISYSNLLDNYWGIDNRNILNVTNFIFTNHPFAAIVTYKNTTTLTNNNFTDNDKFLVIRFNNTMVDLNRILDNTILNNHYIVVVDGNHNNFTNGNLSGTNNKYGIYINGVNNTINNTNISNFTDYGLIFNSTATGNLFTNGAIKNNNKGMLILGNNNSINSSTILNNKDIGINNTGNNNSINYNRIYNNTVGLINSGDNTNANFNWWGINNIINQIIDGGSNLNLTHWYVLQLSVDLINTTVNKTMNYTTENNVLLSYRFVTNELVDNGPDLSYDFDVIVLLSNGTMIMGNINEISVDYPVITISPLDYSINAICDDEDVILLLSYPATIVVVGDITGEVEDEVDLVVKLTDKDGNQLANKTIEFYIDGIFVGNATTDPESIAKIYNYLLTNSGNFTIKAKFAGNNEYGQSNGEGKLTFIGPEDPINPIDPDPVDPVDPIGPVDPENDNSNSNNPTATVAMKNTGIPIIVILLVLLAN